MIGVQQGFWAALKAKDSTRFEGILAEGFISRSPYQPAQGRTEFIRTLTSFPAEVLSVNADDLEVHLFGDIAVLTGVQVTEIRLPNGNNVTNKIAITNIFQKTGDKWLMVLAHPVELS